MGRRFAGNAEVRESLEKELKGRHRLRWNGTACANLRRQKSRSAENLNIVFEVVNPFTAKGFPIDE